MTKRLTKIGVNPDFQELSSFVHELPTVFETGGKVIYKGRNACGILFYRFMAFVR